MSPRITLDATEAQSFEAVPEGQYPAAIIEVEEAKDGPNSKYVPVVFEITDGEHAGRKLTRNCPITGKGAGIFLDLYNKATGSDLDVGDLHEIDTDDLVGAELQVVIRHEEYMGEPRANISRVLSA